MRMLIAEKWNECARMILPADCSPLQRREMRRAFYDGAEGLLKLITVGISGEPGTTPSDMDLMLGIDRELKWFAQLVKDGRA